jgi:hypothetical protein
MHAVQTTIPPRHPETVLKVIKQTGHAQVHPGRIYRRLVDVVDDDRLAIAAAEARSGLPDTLRCATRGRLLEAFSGAPLTARLTPAGPGGPPWIVEWRRCGAEPLTGELLLDTSRLVVAVVLFLKLVAGGSGSGRTRDV